MENEAGGKAGRGWSEPAIERETLPENKKTKVGSKTKEDNLAMGGESRHRMRVQWRNKQKWKGRQGWTTSRRWQMT